MIQARRVAAVVLLGAWLAAPAAAQTEARREIQIQMPDGRPLRLEGTLQELQNTAEGYVNRGEYNTARLVYQELIRQDPNDVRNHLLLGQLYHFQLGKYADALYYYKRAERMVPPDNPGGRAFCQRLAAEAYRALAEKTNSLIYFVQAIGEYEKVLAFEPDNAEVLYLLGTCRLNSRDYDTAIALFKQVIEKAPGSNWAEMAQKALRAAEEEARERDNYRPSRRSSAGS